MCSIRFGQSSSSQIDEEISTLMPVNTKKANTCVWKQFEAFCKERVYSLNGDTSIPQVAEILKDFAFNMKKRDGSDYKEGVVKTQWNRIAKLLQEKFHKEFGTTFDPFKDVVFKDARSARDAKRRQLQVSGEKRKSSASILTEDEQNQIIALWNEDTPEGLQRKFFHIVALELAWRGGEAAECLITFFEIEKDNLGEHTGRIVYNPIFSKTCQGGGKPLTQKKWLVENKINPDRCPVRYFLYNYLIFVTETNFSDCSINLLKREAPTLLRIGFS